jgi:hypothetical protein
MKMTDSLKDTHYHNLLKKKYKTKISFISAKDVACVAKTFQKEL